MKRAAQFLWDLWPVILFYLVVVLIVIFGVLKHPLVIPDTPKASYLPTGPDTVPNSISCQFRGSEFCQPKQFDI